MTAHPGTDTRGSIRIAVDIGGTFTDGIAEDPGGRRIWLGKCLTTPDDPGEGVSDVIDQLLAQINASQIGFAATDVDVVVHATTLVTNTLIERKGVRTALVVTRGTRDVPDIGREIRYDLYDLDIDLPVPLVPPDLRFEIGARLGAWGNEIEPLREDDLAALCDRLVASSARSVAVCLLHAYGEARHELLVESAVARAAPGLSISLSSRIAPEPREYERMSTVAANAYVQPLVSDYLGQIEARFAAKSIGSPVRIMLSSGGFCSAAVAAASPIQLLESGPAAGVLSAINAGATAGHQDILAFDMGGTTAKACVVVRGEPPVIRSFETARVKRFKKGSGLPVLIPTVDLIEIGAGGGSIARIGPLGTLVVGPESAGSVPGPACYGRGGADATVTDADLLLGYLSAERFLGGEMPLDRYASERAIRALGDRLSASAIKTAWGICSIVNENMAGAARVHIAEKGLDPRVFTLVATGGAGPVHAVDVARRLRLSRVLCPIAAGAGSCIGLLAAPARAERSWQRAFSLPDVAWDEVDRRLRDLYHEASEELSAADADIDAIHWSLNLEMRYVGQGHEVDVTVPFDPGRSARRDNIRTHFEERYRLLYGLLVPGAEVEIQTWRLIGRSPSTARRFEWGDGRTDRSETVPREMRSVYLPLSDAMADVPVFDRYAIAPGIQLRAPLLLEERETTFAVPFHARVRILQDLTVEVLLESEGSA